MKKSYWPLMLVILVAAGAISLLGSRGSYAPSAERAEIVRPIDDLSVTIEGGGVVPVRVSVEKGHDVRLRIVNGDAQAHHIELAGYADRVSIELEAGATWEGTFTADLPGNDFVWLVDGAPAGRFDVRGSHLVEGHR